MIYRLFSILTELLDKQKVTAKYLSNMLGVSVRTIYRDIDVLSSCNIPIYCTNGRGGGIYIGEEYKLPATMMSMGEMEYLRTIANKLPESDKDKYERILSKINSVNTPTGSHINSSSLFIQSGASSQNNLSSKITAIDKAINNCTELKISYIGRSREKTVRTVKPLNFVINNNEWYLYAYCNLKQDYRVFKLSRITQIYDTANKFPPITDYKKTWDFDKWFNGTPRVNIILEVYEKALYQVEEWLGIEAISDIDGKHIAKSTQYLNDELIYKLLSLGDGIKVLEPTQVIQNLQTVIDNIIANNR